MKTKLSIALAAFVMVFASCQKSPEDSTETPGTTTEDYQPTSAGSTWKYNSTNQGTYTETALSGDTTISGQKFSKIDNDATGRRYVNKNGAIYTSYGYLPQIDTTLIDTTLTLLYLKDAEAGTTWTNVSVYSGIPVTLTYIIASRDGEKNVNNTNYKNVIALDFAVTAVNPLSGQTLTVATGKQFYAKGVGAILSTLHLAAGTVQIDDSTYLESHTIK